MKRITKSFLILASVLMASFTFVDDAIAQNGIEKEKDYVFLFGTAHKDTAVVRVLFENAPQYFNAPDMPRFAIIGRDRRFYLGIGGYLKASLSYDLGNPIVNTTLFETSSIPMDNPAGNGTLVQFTAATSNLFFNFVALPHTRNKIGAYINFNFNSEPTGYGFNLRAAYVTYRGFLIGYNSSLFTDGAASAPTIDQEGPNSMTFIFNTVLDYQYQFNKHWGIGIGLEMPMVSGTYNKKSYSVNQRIPDIPAYVQYSWKNGAGWVRASGILRNMYYRDVTIHKNIDNVGWGVKLSGALPMGQKLTAFYQGVYGAGVTNYIQDLEGYGMDMVPVSGENGTVRKVKAWGAYLGLQYKFCSKFLMSATYSRVQTYLPKSNASDFTPGTEYVHDNSFMPGSTYKNAQYVVANMFYNITPSVTTGLEYLWGSRRNIDDNFKQDTRLQMAVRVNF